MRSRGRKLERQLRKGRPEPRRELVDAIVAQARTAPRGSSARLRVAFAGALTLVLLVALGAVGGIGLAASTTNQAINAVKKVFVGDGAVVVRGLSAGGDQYRPGYGWGDPNHNHTGPPGLKREGGAFQPLLTAKTIGNGKASTVSTKIVLDEQAHLWISVLNAKGKALLLTQKGSKVGKGVKGRQTKFIQYLALVPRTIPLTLRIPSNLLVKGQTYRIRVVAKDKQGNKRLLVIPFRA